MRAAAIRRTSAAATAAALLVLTAHSANPARAAETIVVTTTIQAAVNAARPGDVVVVPAGVYRENVTVTTSGLTIRASRGAVLDGTGLPGTVGLRVRATTGRIAGFTLDGLRVQHYPFTGVLLSGVDDFRLTGGVYDDNEEYGLFPVRCSHGRVDHNTVTGSEDSGIYVGQCTNVQVDHNLARRNTVGIEIELSTDIAVADNVATDNAIGAVVQLVPGLAATVTDRVYVTGNVFSGNVAPNAATDPGEPLYRLPAGVGVVNVGGDHVRIIGNIITGNPTAGIGVISLPADFAAFDPRLDPAPDANIVRGNVVVGNGTRPDPRVAPLSPADVVWDGTGAGTCFDLRPATSTFPSPLPAC